VTDAHEMPDETLAQLLAPAFREALDRLSAGQPDEADRERVADLLAAAAEAAQEALGEAVRDPRIHRIAGVAASAAMALSLGGDVVPVADVTARLREGLALLAAGS
jgi:hypothetical protein